MKIPMIGKKVVKKSYSSVLTQFKTAITDMQEIVSREAGSIKKLEAEKETIENSIYVADREIDNCEVAIANISEMFPGLKPKPVEVAKK